MKLFVAFSLAALAGLAACEPVNDPTSQKFDRILARVDKLEQRVINHNTVAPPPRSGPPPKAGGGG